MRPSNERIEGGARVGEPCLALEREVLVLKVQVLLLPQARSAAGVAQVVSILGGLGMHVVGQGQTSVSARIEPEVFQKVFGLQAEQLHGDEALPLPTSLSTLVQSITLAPRHLVLGSE